MKNITETRNKTLYNVIVHLHLTEQFTLRDRLVQEFELFDWEQYIPSDSEIDQQFKRFWDLYPTKYKGNRIKDKPSLCKQKFTKQLKANKFDPDKFIEVLQAYLKWKDVMDKTYDALVNSPRRQEFWTPSMKLASTLMTDIAGWMAQYEDLLQVPTNDSLPLPNVRVE